MARTRGTGGVVFAALAIAACCAVPALVAVGGGALAAAGGLVARHWPLTVLGGAAVVIGAARIVSLVRARNRKLRADRRDDG